MKKWKLGLMSFCIGVALSVAPIAVYAACDATTTYRDSQQCHIEYSAHLVDSGCNSDGSVCWCYDVNDNNCGHWIDGPCPEDGPIN